MAASSYSAARHHPPSTIRIRIRIRIRTFCTTARSSDAVLHSRTSLIRSFKRRAILLFLFLFLSFSCRASCFAGRRKVDDEKKKEKKKKKKKVLNVCHRVECGVRACVV
jgi:hypothetical protein